mmetsp:Transcript_128567/g.357924  ORF Transcript_128567/g.357924 Transcript_128567/m.357924 type:complete len:418 (+) Transcript_128567:1-1254(+)
MGWQLPESMTAASHLSGAERGITARHMDKMSGALIISNIIFMVIETEFTMVALRNREAEPEWIWWGGLSFGILFCLELGLRICIERCAFLTGSQWRWNVFDVLLVLSQVLDLLTNFADMSFFRGLRIFRAARMARVLLVTRMVRELRLMLASMYHSMSALIWLVVMLFLVLLFFGLAAQEAVFFSLKEHNLDDVHKDLFKYYGSLRDTMLTLFMSITGGADWEDLVAPLTYFSKVYVLGFVAFQVFLAFGLLNIINAIFLESTSRIAEIDWELAIQDQLDRENSAINQLRQIMHSADGDHSGTITKGELEVKLQDGGFRSQLAYLEADAVALRGLHNLLDRDGTGEADVEELVYGLMRLKGNAKGMDVAALMHESFRIHGRFTQLEQAIEELRRGPHIVFPDDEQLEAPHEQRPEAG